MRYQQTAKGKVANKPMYRLNKKHTKITTIGGKSDFRTCNDLETFKQLTQEKTINML